MVGVVTTLLLSNDMFNIVKNKYYLSCHKTVICRLNSIEKDLLKYISKFYVAIKD